MKGDLADWGLFLSFMLTPLVGACTWLAVRPELKVCIMCSLERVLYRTCSL